MNNNSENFYKRLTKSVGLPECYIDNSQAYKNDDLSKKFEKHLIKIFDVKEEK